MEQKSCNPSRWQLLKQRLANLPPAEFLRAVRQTPEAIILDVRTEDEYPAGAIGKAVNLNYLGEAFLDQLEALDPEKKYFVYCRTGRRSIRVCTLMQNSGFREVYNLDGGLLRLQKETDQLLTTSHN